MALNKYSPVKTRKRPAWRDYQKSLKKNRSRKDRYRVNPAVLAELSKYAAILVVCVVVIFAGKGFLAWILEFDFSSGDVPLQTDAAKPKVEKAPGFKLQKKDIHALISDKSFVNPKSNKIVSFLNGKNYVVETTIDVPLHNYLFKNMDRRNSRYIAIVAMNPDTGKILAMAGYDKTDSINNPCLKATFPSASIFKLVAAAAAVEQLGYTANSIIKYNGRKHTLYKRQLKDRNNKYTQKVSLKKSFAESINPVFGKLGANLLKRQALEKYADAFWFNKEINFEMPVSASSFSISDESYEWAEIASGFNRDTVISPIHGALMASAVINNGNMIEPTLVEKILDSKGDVAYQSKPEPMNAVVSKKTTKELITMMRATVDKGTGRKAFRGYTRDHVLKRLNIGGKTGSISNKSHEVRFDWFIGFAEEKKGPGRLVMSVVVGHHKYIGKRATYYARIAMKHYFKEYFLTKDSKITNNP